MKARLAWIGIASLLLAGFQGQKIVFRDKGGTMEVTGFASWATRRLDGNRLSFLGVGQPVVAKWSRQAMEARANRIEGLVVRQGEAFELVSADLSGQVRATFQRGSAQRSPTTLRVESGNASYASGSSQLRLTGGVRLTQEEPATKQSFDIRGQNATAALAPVSGSAPSEAVKSLEVDGGVRFRFVRQGDKGLDLDGTSDRLSYDSAQGVLVLVGNVHLRGEDLFYGGEAWANKATIRLDAARNPTSVELEGAPAESAVRRKAAAER